MKIAFTSLNFRTITGHAGKTHRFLVLEPGPDGEPRIARHLELPRHLAFHHFHGDGPHPVDDCDLLVTQSCGAGFVQRLAARNIRVVVTSETDPWKVARAVLNGEALPPPDLRRSHNHHHCGCDHPSP